MKASAFFIDMRALAWSMPLSNVEQKLLDLSMSGQTGPFPASPGMNYNVLAAGFDMATKKHALPWKTENSESSFPPQSVVVPALRCIDAIFRGGTTSEYWSTGVFCIKAFLESIQDHRDQTY